MTTTPALSRGAHDAAGIACLQLRPSSETQTSFKKPPGAVAGNVIGAAEQPQPIAPTATVLTSGY
jgi:hypothetical protein